MKVTTVGNVDARDGLQHSSEILGQHPAFPVLIGAPSNFTLQHIYEVFLAY